MVVSQNLTFLFSRECCWHVDAVKFYLATETIRIFVFAFNERNLKAVFFKF